MTLNPGTGRCWNCRSWREYWNRHSWRESWRKSPSSAGITIPRWNTGITILGGDPGANPCSQYFPVTPGPPWITMDHSGAGNTGNTQWCPDAGWRCFPDLPKQFLLLLEKPGAFPAFSGKHNPCWIFQPLSQGNLAELRAPSPDRDEGWLGTPGLGIASRRDPKFCCGAPKSLFSAAPRPAPAQSCPFPGKSSLGLQQEFQERRDVFMFPVPTPTSSLSDFPCWKRECSSLRPLSGGSCSWQTAQGSFHPIFHIPGMSEARLEQAGIVGIVPH